MIHSLNLQSTYFNFIKNGTKRIELRLYDEKRSKINLDDTIIFTNNSTNETFNTRVVGLLRYSSFKDLFKDFGIDILADESIAKQELINTLNEFYTLEKQNEFGVVGIRVELI